MIKSLQIKNIQSHEDTELDFASGINVIIGSSNQGKSAILRALYWVRTNRPLGIDNLASHWAVNEKGNLTDSMLVILVNDKGTVERRRTKDENQYIVNGEVLNVVKTDVPIQVSSLLNLSDTNVQKQLDSPFLLSQTSGEVAKYFNQMVNLDIIDKVLVTAETTRRKLKNNVESLTDAIEVDERSLSEYSWVDDAESLIEEYEALSSKDAELNRRYNEIANSLDKYNDMIEYIGWVESHVLANKGCVSEIEETKKRIMEVDYESEGISHSIKTFEGIETYDFTLQNKWIARIKFLQESFDDSKLLALKRSIEDYDSKMEFVEFTEKAIKEDKARLPKMCPLCGKPLEDDVCGLC